MKLYISSITDKEGKVKNDFYNKLKLNHSLYGQFYSEPKIGHPFYFLYDDDTNQCLRSSNIDHIDYIENDKLYVIETRNSIYYIKEVEE